MKDSVFIIPVHNRCIITRACLRRLQEDGVMSWARILVVDDGSSDGTADMIQREFPDVQLVQGNGQLWWTGAVELGMRSATAANPDCYIWLNDDMLPHPGACAQLVSRVRATGAIVVGQCRAVEGGLIVYGGLVRKNVSLHLLPVEGTEIKRVVAACGNFVGIPRAVVERIGFPDGRRLPHAHGDTDYTLRAHAAGFQLLVDPQAEAIGRPNALGNYASWLLSDIRLWEIWSPLWDRRSYAYAPAHARFLARHFGWRGFLYWFWTVFKRVPITLLRMTTTIEWRRSVWGSRSAAWGAEQQLRALAQDADPTSAATGAKSEYDNRPH